QMDAAISFYRQIEAYTLAQFSTPIVCERYAIPWCRCLAAKKWRPVIVKVLKDSWDIDWPDRYIGRGSRSPRRAKRRWSLGLQRQSDLLVQTGDDFRFVIAVIDDSRPGGWTVFERCRTMSDRRVALVREEGMTKRRRRRGAASLDFVAGNGLITRRALLGGGV